MPIQTYAIIPKIDLIERISSSRLQELEGVREYEPAGREGRGIIYHYNNCTLAVNNSQGTYPLQIFGKTKEAIDEDARKFSEGLEIQLKAV